MSPLPYIVITTQWKVNWHSNDTLENYMCVWSSGWNGIMCSAALDSSGADSMWHGGTCPHFYKWMGTGGTMSRRTVNKKLTKLYWPSRKRSPKRLIVLLEPKSGGARPKKNFFPALRARLVPPHFRSGPVPPLPLSNSFRRHCWPGKNCTLFRTRHLSKKQAKVFYETEENRLGFEYIRYW